MGLSERSGGLFLGHIFFIPLCAWIKVAAINQKKIEFLVRFTRENWNIKYKPLPTIMFKIETERK